MVEFMSDPKIDNCYFCERIIRKDDTCYDPWKDEIILCPICYGKYMKLSRRKV
jgi:hypothetical protein